MSGQSFRISGRVQARHSTAGISGLRIEAWDKDLLFDDLVGSAVTDQDGRFTIEIAERHYRELFLDQRPDLFFRVYRGGELIAHTEDSVLWNLDKGETSVVIEVDVPRHEPVPFSVEGQVRDSGGRAFNTGLVRAFDRDLRREQLLGECRLDRQGRYRIGYDAGRFCRAEKGAADLLVKVAAADGSVLAVSEVVFDAPPAAHIDLTISAETLAPASLFEAIARSLTPLLDGLKVAELEQDPQHRDLGFLAGETGVAQRDLTRFVVAHRLAAPDLPPEAWFALLGASFFPYGEDKDLQGLVSEVQEALTALDAASLRKSLERAFERNDIPASLHERLAAWLEAFLDLAAGVAVGEGKAPGFVKSALEHAGVLDGEKQRRFARLFNEHGRLSRSLLEALEEEALLQPAEVADLRTSFDLAELSRGDFSVVRMIKEAFDVRRPEQVRGLARKSDDDWVRLVVAKHAAGEVALPFASAEIAGLPELPEAELYGKTLARRFRDAFPTVAFNAGLSRALGNVGVKGLRHAEALSGFLSAHEGFELLTTPVDEFLDGQVHPDFQGLAEDAAFRAEVKAVQRVFKLAPSFEATDALLADGLHSAQKIYRVGRTEIVRRYGQRPGFTPETALRAWGRAADTHAAVLTLVADLKALEADDLPMVLQRDGEALASFPSWGNLFQGGDLCDCQHCRSVLGPAAYFADVMMFLADRDSRTGHGRLKDILLQRRPDLGFLELSCANALTPVPYIDLVCEVLEAAVDEADENDLELPALAAIPTDLEAAKIAVAAAFEAALADPVNDGKSKSPLGDEPSLARLEPSDPNRWVVHGDRASYLLQRAASASHFSARVLPNTKTGADLLRAYPQYVNPNAYETLKQARYPLELPFDLDAEEIEAALAKVKLGRWDLMRTLRGPSGPSDPDIACAYFGIRISADPATEPDERGLILDALSDPAALRTVWGESGHGDWLDRLGNVKTLLERTRLD